MTLKQEMLQLKRETKLCYKELLSSDWRDPAVRNDIRQKYDFEAFTIALGRVRRES